MSNNKFLTTIKKIFNNPEKPPAESSNKEHLALFQTRLGKYYLPTNITNDIIINEMKAGKIFERKVVDAAKSYITKGSTVIDVGANLGQMTLLFSKFVGENGKVFSFEADEFIFDILKKNIDVNHRKNITAISKAVYDKNGETMFYPAPDFQRFESYGSYGLDPNAKEGRRVETMTIDSLNIQSPVSLMKIDVQGSDLFALRGAVATIRKHRMPIIFEYEEQFQKEFHTAWSDYEAFINSISYKIKKTIYNINFLIVPK